VEVDGGTHATAAEINADIARTRWLEAHGFRIFRVHNVEIYDNLDGVLDTLLAVLQGHRGVTD